MRAKIKLFHVNSGINISEYIKNVFSSEFQLVRLHAPTGCNMLSVLL